MRLVGDVESFETSHWGRAVAHRSHGAGAFADVWSVSAMDEFLSNTPRRPLVRLVADGSPVDPGRYTRRVRLGGTDFSDVIDPSGVADLFDGGATVVAQSLHRTSSPVRVFVDGLSSEVFHPVQANSYLTPPGSRGLSPHSDRHDVFVVQVHGSKRWDVAGLGPVDVSDGDVLYIPAGVTHSAQSTDESSLHLTIGLVRTTYRSIVERILRTGATALDDPVPLRPTHAEALPDGLRRRLDASVEALRDADVDDLGRELRDRRRRRIAPSGSIGRSVDLADVGASALIRRRDRWTVELDGDSVVITTDASSLHAPGSCAPAMRQLEHGDPVLVGDLDGLDESSRCILARRLLAAGLCDRVDHRGGSSTG